MGHLRSHSSRVAELTDAHVEFGHILPEHWHQPSWINETRATEERHKMENNRVIYGGKKWILSFVSHCALKYCRQRSVSVDDTRFCVLKLIITTKIPQYVPLQFRSRFRSHSNSENIWQQFFYRHELLKPYKYYWR